MKRLALLLLVPVTGCSTSPAADFLDHFFPAKPSAVGPGRGGVCDPLSPAPGVAGPSMPAIPGGTVVVPAPGAPVVPGPGAPVMPGTPPPLSSTMPPPPFPLTSTPAAPEGPEAKPLPAPPLNSSPPLN